MKSKLKAALINGLVERGVFNLPAPVESPGSVAGAMAAVSPGEGYFDTAEPSSHGRSDPQAGEAVKLPPVDRTPGVKRSEVEGKLPPFEPLSVDTSPGSRLDARLRIRLARLQLEKEEREREFQLWRELELRRLEAQTAIKMRQLELQTCPVSFAGAQSSSDLAAAFDVSKTFHWSLFFVSLRLRVTSVHLSALLLLCVGQKMCGLVFCNVS